MPFKSQAQRRKFAQLLVEGKISPATFEEWNRETGDAELPEHAARKRGAKRAAKKKGGARKKTASKKTARKSAAKKKSSSKPRKKSAKSARKRSR